MSSYHCPDAKKISILEDLANRIRMLSIESTSAAGSGHPTSCCSQAEVMSVLFFHTMKYKVSAPKDASNDRFILSKGHAAPALYAAWCEAGLFSKSELMKLRKIDSDLEGHPTPRLNFIDVATGSLGQGLSVACGMAYCGKYFDKANYRVFCLLGDGESAEGSVWEAMSFASHYKLDNLCIIIDVNRLGQSEPTALGHEMDVYKARCESFGLNSMVIDGHSVPDLCKAMYEAEECRGRPSIILAQTYKGKGISGVENLHGFHGKALGDRTDKALAEIGNLIQAPGAPAPQPRAVEDTASAVDPSPICLSESPSYSMGEKVATRVAYGTALVKVGRNSQRVVALDADMKNSTFSEKFKNEFPGRFIECFIAEQNMIGVGVGVACRDRTVAFCSTFACFLTRAFDQLRMAAVSMSNINVLGSHVGISIGEDGPSQMGLEDLGMFRSIHASTVFYPSDAVAMEYAVQLAANTPGICYLRASRPTTPVIYANDEQFAIGKAKTVRRSDADKALVVGAGVTLFEALAAADTLAAQGVNIRVMDPFTIKPIDAQGLAQAAGECNGNVIVIEDHYPEGGIGEAVSGALLTAGARLNNFRHLCVRALPRSGPPAVLARMFGISADDVVKAVQSF